MAALDGLQRVEIAAADELERWLSRHHAQRDAVWLVTHKKGAGRPHVPRAEIVAELIAWGWHGSPGLCGPYFEPVMDKTAYKTQLTYPIPNTAKEGGRCCQPFGRTTITWGAGHTITYGTGPEDASA